MIKNYSTERHLLPNFRQRFPVLKGLNDIRKDILSYLKNINTE